MKILSIDIGGSHVKILCTGQSKPRKIESGKKLTPTALVSAVKKLAAGWRFERVSIGYPGITGRNGPAVEPGNLGHGWVGFDFAAAFELPVKIVNDAAMQALGSYEGGKMLFLGLGTGLGSAMIVDGALVPMELGHLPYRKDKVFEDFVGAASLKRHGKKKWASHVHDVVDRLIAALEPDYVVLGGGNADKLGALPKKSRLGKNGNAFLGGFRLWRASSHAA